MQEKELKDHQNAVDSSVLLRVYIHIILCVVYKYVNHLLIGILYNVKCSKCNAKHFALLSNSCNFCKTLYGVVIVNMLYFQGFHFQKTSFVSCTTFQKNSVLRFSPQSIAVLAIPNLINVQALC